MAITYATPSGKSVGDLVDKLETVAEGEPSATVLAAALALAILSQKPDVAPAELADAIKNSSEHLMTLLFNASPTEAVQ